MLQQKTPGDYVLATNETHTVRQFVEAALRNLELQFAGRARALMKRDIMQKRDSF